MLDKAEVPEVKREDMKIVFSDGVITISGERKREMEEQEANEIRIESFYGPFSRSFSLSDNVDRKSIRGDQRRCVACSYSKDRNAQSNRHRRSIDRLPGGRAVSRSVVFETTGAGACRSGCCILKFAHFRDTLASRGCYAGDKHALRRSSTGRSDDCESAA